MEAWFKEVPSSKTEGRKRFTGKRGWGTALTHFCSALLLSAVLLVCGGWGNTWREIQSAAGKIDTIEADFTQEKHLKILSKPLVSKGAFYYLAPNSLRWEYTAPFKSILLLHDGKTRRYMHNGSAFTEDTDMNAQGMQVVLQQIALWLGGRFEEDPIFQAALKPDRVIVLTPREKAFSQMIQHIDLKLSDTPGILKSVTIYEGPDSFTRLLFSNVRINQGIPVILFQKVP